MHFPLQAEYTVSGMPEMKAIFNLFEFGDYTLSYHGEGIRFIYVSSTLYKYQCSHNHNYRYRPCHPYLWPLHRMRRKTSHLVLVFLYFSSYTCVCAWVDVHVCGGQRLTLWSSSTALHLFDKTEALTEPECNNLARSSCLHKCWACRHVLPCLAF